MKFLDNKWVMFGAGIIVGAGIMHLVMMPKTPAAPPAAP